MNATQVTMVFGPVAVLVCLVAFIQRWSWRQPPKTPQQVRARATWQRVFPMGQFGIRLGLDGFVYSNATGRCLGIAGGAKATATPVVPVTRLKPSTGWAVITFADGTTHRQPYALRNQAEAAAQMARFNGLATQQAHAAFRRTWRPPAAPRP